MPPHHGEGEVVGRQGAGVGLGGGKEEARKKDRQKQGHKKRGPLG